MDYYLTKSEPDWMCDLYYQGSPCLSYKLLLSFCYILYLCIALPFNPTLGGGDVDTYYSIVEPNLVHNLDLFVILVLTLSLPHGDINLQRISLVLWVRHWYHKTSLFLQWCLQILNCLLWFEIASFPSSIFPFANKSTQRNSWG